MNHLYLQVSGREVFEFRPELVDDDDAEADDTQYDNDDVKDDEEQVSLKLSTLFECLCGAQRQNV